MPFATQCSPCRAPYCPALFSHQGALLRHEVKSHPKASGTSEGLLKNLFRCNWCTSLLYSVADLSKHKQRVHGYFEINMSMKPPGIFTCGLCSKPFAEQWELHDHEKVMHYKFGETESLMTSSPPQFPCNHCTMLFPQKGALICHKALYHRKEINKNINTKMTVSQITNNKRKLHDDLNAFAKQSELQEAITTIAT